MVKPEPLIRRPPKFVLKQLVIQKAPLAALSVFYSQFLTFPHKLASTSPPSPPPFPSHKVLAHLTILPLVPSSPTFCNMFHTGW